MTKQILLTLSLLAVSSFSLASDWSAGVIAGASSFNIDGASRDDSEYSELAVSIEAEHHYNKNFGVKLGYFSPESGDFSLGLAEFNADKNTYKSKSLTLAATARTQSRWFVFAGLGLNISKETINGSYLTNSVSEDSVKLYVDFGTGFKFTRNLTGKISYQNRQGKIADVDTLGFGLNYSF